MENLYSPKRRYFSNECGLESCPECGGELTKEYCSILLHVKSNKDEGELMTSASGSHFCDNCPVVVFDTQKLDEVALIGFGGNNIQHYVKGIVNFDAIPKEKKHLPIGSKGNPTPLVVFLPDLDSKIRPATNTPEPKIGRNDPCHCGSGAKYKKCCGK